MSLDCSNCGGSPSRCGCIERGLAPDLLNSGSGAEKQPVVQADPLPVVAVEKWPKRDLPADSLFDVWWKENEARYMADAMHMSLYHMAATVWDAARMNYASDPAPVVDHAEFIKDGACP